MQAMGRQFHQATDGALVHCERHSPDQTTLYRLVQRHGQTFFAQTEDATGASLPQFTADGFDAFLECGTLAHGFLRLRCVTTHFVLSLAGLKAEQADSGAVKLTHRFGSAANLNIHLHCLVPQPGARRRVQAH